MGAPSREFGERDQPKKERFQKSTVRFLWVHENNGRSVLYALCFGSEEEWPTVVVLISIATTNNNNNNSKKFKILSGVYIISGAALVARWLLVLLLLLLYPPTPALTLSDKRPACNLGLLYICDSRLRTARRTTFFFSFLFFTGARVVKK